MLDQSQYWRWCKKHTHYAGTHSIATMGDRDVCWEMQQQVTLWVSQNGSRCHILWQVECFRNLLTAPTLSTNAAQGRIHYE